MTAASEGPARVDAATIYAQLRREILSGVLAPGTPAREVNIADRFGVSRTPVREALRSLQHDRLLVAGPRSLQVRRIDSEEVIQVYDMRIVLEGEAARQAAAARNTTDVVALEGLLARDRSLDDPDDPTRTNTNIEFHQRLWTATHNPVLQDLLARLTIHLVRTPHSTLSTPGRWESSLDEHQGILEAIRDRDGDAAQEAAAAHMRRAREIRLDLLRDSAAAETADAP